MEPRITEMCASPMTMQAIEAHLPIKNLNDKLKVSCSKSTLHIQRKLNINLPDGKRNGGVGRDLVNSFSPSDCHTRETQLSGLIKKYLYLVVY